MRQKMEDPILVTRSSLPPLEEYVEMLKPIWDSAWLTNMGDYHETLKEQLKEYLGVANLELFVNGHMGLELALQAFQMEEGGEVITTPFSFASTTHAIVRNGLTPVFCDINEEDYTLDVDRLEELVTERTCAIVPVHVYGNLCDVDRIQEIADRHRLRVIYDAAHAFGQEKDGAGVGRFGDASMFSFHATKVFHSIEGGAVAFREPWLADRLYQLKNFGITGYESVEYVGANGKMNEFQAAMGLCNLRHVEGEIRKRKALALRCRESVSVRSSRGSGTTMPTCRWYLTASGQTGTRYLRSLRSIISLHGSISTPASTAMPATGTGSGRRIRRWRPGWQPGC